MRADRLLIAFLLLIGAFVVLVGFAVNSLLTVGQYTLAAMVGGAGLAGTVAGGVTFWWLRQEEEVGLAELEPLLPPTEAIVGAAGRTSIDPGATAHSSLVQPALAHAAVARRLPPKVQAMPVADLPSAYVDAVLRGAHSRLRALKTEARHSAPP